MQNLSNFSTQNISGESDYLIQNLTIDQQFIIAQTLITLFGIGLPIFLWVTSLKKIEWNGSFEKKLMLLTTFSYRIYSYIMGIFDYPRKKVK